MSLFDLNPDTLKLNTQEMLLLGFFKLDPFISHRDKGYLESLRIEPRNFNVSLFEQLNALGLVEYDTTTGIAFQSPEQWEVKLTEAGINLICAVKNLETETLAIPGHKWTD